MAKTVLEDKWIHIHDSLMANKMPLDDLAKYVPDAKAYADYIIDMKYCDHNISKKALFAFLETCLVYYTYSESGSELITDTEYDKCMERWVNMGNEPITTTEYDSHGLGTRWEIVRHDYPNMVGSLLKEYSIDKFVQIIDDFYDMRGSKRRIHYAPKFDGNSICISFNNGKMLRALTRKNGKVGQDVGPAVRRFQNYDSLCKLAVDFFGMGPGAIKCEILCDKSEYNSEDVKKRYANCRSAVSGIMSSPKNLDLAHHLHAQPLAIYDASTKRYTYLASYTNGMITNHPLSAHEIEEMLEKFRSSDFPVRIDGVVAYVENEDPKIYDNDAMATAYAFKVNSAVGITKIKSSYFSLGRGGRATPMITVEPCDVNETIVTDVNLSSIAKMKSLRLHIGDTIEIESAGDVIPMIKRVIERNKHGEELSFSSKCPYCGHKLTPLSEGIIGCVNPYCPRVLSGQLANFFEIVGMKGFSDECFIDLVENAHVHSVYDVLTLTESDLRNIKWGNVTISNFMDEIKKIKDKPIDEALFIGALGIPGISVIKCKKILSEMPLSRIFGWIDRGLPISYVTDAIADIDGFGMKSARVFSEFIDSNYSDIKNAMKELDIIPYQKKLGRFTLTGFTDDAIEKKLTDLGYEIGGLTKDTIALIAADPRTNSGKAQKARQYGIPIITEDELDTFIEKIS